MTFPRSPVAVLAEDFLNEDLEVVTVEDALQVQETSWQSNSQMMRKFVTKYAIFTRADGKIISSVKKAE